MNAVREVLNRLRWDEAAERADVVVEVRTRESGAERVAAVPYDALVEILPNGVTLAGETFLPYHRFVRVRRGAEVLWPPAGGAER